MKTETILENVDLQSKRQNHDMTRKKPWAGYLFSAPPALFLLLDAAMKLVKPAPVVEATVKLGYPESCLVPLGVILLISTALYLIRRTSVLGAILLTGYLGGAVATHVRVGGGLFPILFPVFFGILLWGGLYLRDERLRALLAPVRR